MISLGSAVYLPQYVPHPLQLIRVPNDFDGLKPRSACLGLKYLGGPHTHGEVRTRVSVITRLI